MAFRVAATLVRALERILGRRELYRLGRMIYLRARRDGAGDPALNGEYALHRRLARYARGKKAPFRIVDVGANTGYWSLHLLEACRTAGVDNVQLWAFEPSDEIRAQLIDRLRSVSPNYQVTVRSEAVADVSGRASFDGTSGVTGIKRLLIDAQPGTPRVEVPVTTLADVFAEQGIDAVDFVKTDIEGYDLRALQGALPLLRNGRIGLLQFEYNHCWIATRSFLKDVFALVDGLHYRVAKVVPDGIEAYEVWHPELETFFDANFVLMRDDLIAPLGVREGRFDAQNAYTLN